MSRVLTPIVVHTAKDFLPDRRVRWPVIAGWYAFATGTAYLVFRRARVIPRSSRDRGPAAAYQRIVVSGLMAAGYLALQRLIGARLRATRLRRPNLVAGLVMAGVTAGQQLLLWELWHKPSPDDLADDPAGAVAHLHPALEAPTALRLCATLNAATVDLEYVRAELLPDTPDLDEQLQLLTADDLVTHLNLFGRRWAFATPRGRDLFAQHVQALRRISQDGGVSTGDTPR